MSDRFGYGEIGLGIESDENDKQTTNADRIRSMSNEELAEWLAKTDPECDTKEWWLRWLESEARWLKNTSKNYLP